MLQGMDSWDPEVAVGEVAADAAKAERTPGAKARTAEPGGKLGRGHRS